MKLKNLFNLIFTRIIIFLVQIYQLTISPLKIGTCRYIPSCSQYMIASVKKHGAFCGFWYGICRISRCHPWSKHTIIDEP